VRGDEVWQLRDERAEGPVVGFRRWGQTAASPSGSIGNGPGRQGEADRAVPDLSGAAGASNSGGAVDARRKKAGGSHRDSARRDRGNISGAGSVSNFLGLLPSQRQTATSGSTPRSCATRRCGPARMSGKCCRRSISTGPAKAPTLPELMAQRAAEIATAKRRDPREKQGRQRARKRRAG